MKGNHFLKYIFPVWATILMLLTPFMSAWSQVTTYNTGSGAYTVPTGTTHLKVEVWGGGGKGGTRTTNGGGGGGGGGAYSSSIIEVAPGTTSYRYAVGAGSSGTGAGGASWVGTTTNQNSALVLAVGGNSVANNTLAGATGGQASAGIGDVKFSGGNGANGTDNGNNAYGGGGGSSAGIAADGSSGNGSTGGTAPVGGGSGGAGRTGTSGAGTAGSAPGGGGGGARKRVAGTYNGGNGANGQVVFTPITDVPMDDSSEFWLRADIGTSTTTNNSSVTNWDDVSGGSNNGISPTSSGTGYTASATHPSYVEQLWNFNPGVKFDNGYFRNNRGALGNDMTFYTIYSSTQTTASGSWWTSPAIIGAEAGGAQNDFGLGHNAGRLFFKGLSDDNISSFTQTESGVNYNNGAPKIVTATRTIGSSATNYIYVNGVQKGSSSSGNYTLSDPNFIGVGRNPTETSSQFIGYISEAVGTSYVATELERQIFETYLAIKYGITLPYDYKRDHFSENVIYSIANGYSHDIAGLGRNDVLGLHQKVSSSINVASGSSRIVMATSNDFTSSNLAVGRPDLTHGQYLIWGHNNAATNSWENMSIGSLNLKKVPRNWRIHNTSNVGEVDFQIDLSGYPALDAGYSYALAVLAVGTDDSLDHLYKLTNTSGNLYTTKVTFPIGSKYFTIAAYPKNYWIGTTDSDWNKNSNWTAGAPPAVGEDVEFATVSNWGIAAANDLQVPTGAINAKTIGNLINASDKNLIIPADASLKVNGVVSIADATNVDRIQIGADATNPNGTFIINCDLQEASAQKDIYATIQLYAKSKKLSAEQTWKDNIVGSPTQGQDFTANYTWQFFGVPVQSIVAEPTFYDAFIREYAEDYNGDNSRYYQKWKDVYNETELQGFKGYEITQENPKIYTIAGKLVYCDQTLQLTRKAPVVGLSGAANERYALGQNIFGNSFTASISVDAINFPTGVEEVVYLYNTGSFVDWAETSSTNSGTLAAGQYTAIPKNTGATVYDGKIPSMNGFLVKFLPAYTVYSETDVPLVIPYNNVLEKNSKPQTAPRKSVSFLKIELNSKSSQDNLWLISHPETTPGFDNGWDGRKFFGTPSAFIYADTPDGPMQVSSNSDLDGSIVSFYPNTESDYEIKIIRSSLEGYQDLHLIDLETREVIALNQDTVIYDFYATNENMLSKRFQLIHAENIYINSDKLNLLSYHNSGNRGNLITVNNFTDKTAKLSLYDTAGRLVQSETIRTPYKEILLHPHNGVYILHIEAGNHRVRQKLIIR